MTDQIIKTIIYFLLWTFILNQLLNLYLLTRILLLFESLKYTFLALKHRFFTCRSKDCEIPQVLLQVASVFFIAAFSKVNNEN